MAKRSAGISNKDVAALYNSLTSKEEERLFRRLNKYAPYCNRRKYANKRTAGDALRLFMVDYLLADHGVDWNDLAAAFLRISATKRAVRRVADELKRRYNVSVTPFNVTPRRK